MCCVIYANARVIQPLMLVRIPYSASRSSSPEGVLAVADAVITIHVLRVRVRVRECLLWPML